MPDDIFFTLGSDEKSPIKNGSYVFISPIVECYWVRTEEACLGRATGSLNFLEGQSRGEVESHNAQLHGSPRKMFSS